jgi:hypothetical protein
MSEVKHAREPWSLGIIIEDPDDKSAEREINAKGHSGFASVVWKMQGGSDAEYCKANAERIVACVNACEGVSPEDLRGLSVKGLLDGYLQDDKAKKDLEKRLEMQRAETSQFEALYKHSTEVNSGMLKKQSVLEAELKDAKKLVEKQVAELTASHNFESQLRQENRALQQENHTLLDDQNRLLELREELEKMRLGKEHLAKDLQAIIRAARWGQAPYAVDISTLQAVLQHYGVLPNGD